MVSVLEGQLTRTWFYKANNRNHVINLYHDTITGIRSAMIDFQEIKGSSGSSSLMMEAKGHRIFFTLEDLPGFIEIKRSGWTGFSYACVINDKPVSEATQEIQTDHTDVFKVKIIETTFTADENSEHPIAWYAVKTIRLKDNVETVVHRRFKDFVELNSQVKQNLKGNQLRWCLPPIPEKPLKSMTDHRDPTFIQDRCAKLEIFIVSMVAVPHVSDMVCVKAFLGLMDQVKEFSLSFHVPTIGMSLLPSERLGDNTPAIVGLIQKADICKGVLPGDSISKINGVAVAGMNFNGVVSRIKALPRPLIIHFIQVIASPGSATPAAATAAAAASSSGSVSPVAQRGHTSPSKPLPTFDGDNEDAFVAAAAAAAPQKRPTPAAPAAASAAAAPRSVETSPAPKQTWSTYDDPEEESTVTPRANPMTNKSSSNNGKDHSAATEFDTTSNLTEEMQAVDLNSSNHDDSHSASPAPTTPPPAAVLKAPLPLGWD